MFSSLIIVAAAAVSNTTPVQIQVVGGENATAFWYGELDRDCSHPLDCVYGIAFPSDPQFTTLVSIDLDNINCHIEGDTSKTPLMICTQVVGEKKFTIQAHVHGQVENGHFILDKDHSDFFEQIILHDLRQEWRRYVLEKQMATLQNAS